MRKLILITLIFAGCQKESVKPRLLKVGIQSFASTLPYVTISMYYSNTTFLIDKTQIVFKDSSKASYWGSEDAKYLKGFGVGSLSTLSSDGIQLAINTRPHKQNDTIPMITVFKYSGNYRFKVTSYNAPYKMCILDNGWKCNLDSGFTVDVADSSTFYNRFKFIVK